MTSQIIKIKDKNYQKFGKHFWLGSNADCNLILENLPYFLKKEDLQDLVENSSFSLNVKDQFSKLTLCQILKSTLAFRYENKQLYAGNWSTILLIFF